jgi:hypothetical protein
VGSPSLPLLVDLVKRRGGRGVPVTVRPRRLGIGAAEHPRAGNGEYETSNQEECGHYRECDQPGFNGLRAHGTSSTRATR